MPETRLVCTFIQEFQEDFIRVPKGKVMQLPEAFARLLNQQRYVTLGPANGAVEIVPGDISGTINAVGTGDFSGGGSNVGTADFIGNAGPPAQIGEL